MAPTPSVSVALATFNGERFLEEQLESLRAQTLQPIEILVGDDGSTDRTVDIINAFAASSPTPVRLVRNDSQLGFVDNFFAIARRATGELVAWCDQDDVWYPQKLERCASEFSRSDVMLVIHGARRVDESRQPLERLPNALRRRYPRLSGHPFVVPHGFREVFRRRLVEQFDPAERPVSFHGLRTAHDEFVYFVAMCAGSVRWINETLAEYRAHGGNTTGALRTEGVAEHAWGTHTATSTAADVADRRAAYLDSQLHHDAAGWYRRYARSVRRREAVYAAPGRGRMLLAVAAAELGGLYGPRRWGRLGPQAAAKDLTLALRYGGPIDRR